MKKQHLWFTLFVIVSLILSSFGNLLNRSVSAQAETPNAYAPQVYIVRVYYGN